jgi:hypothetical protein
MQIKETVKKRSYENGLTTILKVKLPSGDASWTHWPELQSDLLCTSPELALVLVVKPKG